MCRINYLNVFELQTLWTGPAVSGSPLQVQFSVVRVLRYRFTTVIDRVAKSV